MTRTNVETRVRRLHQRGVQATASGRPADGAQLLRAGLRLLGWTDEAPVVTAADLAALLLISLAHAEAERGRTGYGFELLDAAEALVNERERGILIQQRGLLLQRVGRDAEALAQLDTAVPLLEEAGQRLVLARTLLNRGSLHARAGRIAASTTDLERSAAIALEIGAPLLHAKAVHLRGYNELLKGDVAEALALFATAEHQYATHAPDYVPMVMAARARALLAVGLAREAGRDLDAALAAFARQRLSQERAEAELMRAHAALAADDADTARRWAARAATHFRSRGNDTWVALSELMSLRASAGAGLNACTGTVQASAQLHGTRACTRDRVLAARASALATRLRALGLFDDAEMADLLSARAMIARGRLVEARQRMRAAARGRSFGWLETLLTRRITRAELAYASGDRPRALREVRTGLGELHLYRSRIGSLDLRVGAAALGRELSRAGLRMALDGGSPRTVLAWSERVRAQAFRALPVRVEQSPQAAADLAELRHLRDLIRSAELCGRREPEASARCGELERRLRKEAWATPGAVGHLPHASAQALTDALSARDVALVSFIDDGERLAALVAIGDSVRLTHLGNRADITEAARRVQVDVDALAGRELPQRLAAAIHGSLNQHLDVLDRGLLEPLRPYLGDHALILIPTPALTAVPWAMLADLAGRPVTVAPSVSAWLAACARTGPPRSPDALLVAGPDLDHADAELDAIAQSYPTCRVLRGPAARVEATLNALPSSPIAHLAGHGHHETENVLFSRLDLVDGPLMAYDIAHLAAVPALITLSACDVGRSVAKPGDELLGFSAALLYAGGGTVVASVASVAHDTAARIMVRFHRATAGGCAPAEALAGAASGEPLMPFVCFGAG
jgi:tetratricopeptide (TPR) repeat protein